MQSIYRCEETAKDARLAAAICVLLASFAACKAKPTQRLYMRATKRKRERKTSSFLLSPPLFHKANIFIAEKVGGSAGWLAGTAGALKCRAPALHFLRQDKWVSYPAAKLMPLKHTQIERQKYKFSARFPLSFFSLSLVFAAIF